MMPSVAVGLVAEIARKAIHGRVHGQTTWVLLVPTLGIVRRQHTRVLCERVLAERYVVIGRGLHDVSIEDVGVQDGCGVVVVEVCVAFCVGLLVKLMMRVLKLVLNGRVCRACLLKREPVACSSKGHAGAEQVDKRTSVQTEAVRAGDRSRARRGAV